MNTVYVFGSNLLGRHRRGEALRALKRHGAEYGVAEGRVGNSYAIPTHSEDMVPLPLRHINRYITAFKTYAEEHPDIKFSVTRIACHNNEYSDDQMAHLFRDAPPNCILPCGWRNVTPS